MMQDETGRMQNIDPTTFQKMLDECLGDAPVVKIGDIFKIRDCRFEVTDITPDGISAKGLSRGDFLAKKFHY